jgi:hypothetical protein
LATGGAADWQSAKQQVANLRHADNRAGAVELDDAMVDAA